MTTSERSYKLCSFFYTKKVKYFKAMGTTLKSVSYSNVGKGGNPFE